MKRPAVILLLTILLSPLSAGPLVNASFTLSFRCAATVSENTLVKFSEEFLSSESAFDSQRGFDERTPQMDFLIAENTDENTIQGYLAYKTNTSKAQKLKVRPTALKASREGNSHTIDYTLYLNGQSCDTSTRGDMIVITIEAAPDPSVKRVKSYPIGIRSDAASFADAPKDDYRGSIIVYLEQS